jgi:hypothetical protein
VSGGPEREREMARPAGWFGLRKRVRGLGWFSIFFFSFLFQHTSNKSKSNQNKGNTHTYLFYFIYKKQTITFSYTKFPKKRINVGQILKIMRNRCLIIFPINILKLSKFRVLH